MTELNHFAISSLLNSEIVGRSKFGHGQIGSLGGAQKYLDLLTVTEAPTEVHGHETVDVEAVVRAFRALRDRRGDCGSPDLYIADPERNAGFLATCLQFGIEASAYAMNKMLMYARKNNYLPGLKSVKTHFDYENYAFASEFAATELKYQTGATIDDMLCEPCLASRFDAVARKLAPGYTSLQYRWAILTIRKAGTLASTAPDFTEHFRLVKDSLEGVPSASGVYLLSERNRPLYARSTADLRHGIELHRDPQALGAVTGKLWKPNPDDFLVSFAVLPSKPKKLLLEVERKVVKDQKPIFNVPRAA